MKLTKKQSKTSIKSKKSKKSKKIIHKPHLIDKYCSIYKLDITGKPNKPLYNSCKANKYCRKYKCKNIDSIFTNEKLKILGSDYDNIILTSIKNACPLDLENIDNAHSNYKYGANYDTHTIHNDADDEDIKSVDYDVNNINYENTENTKYDSSKDKINKLIKKQHKQCVNKTLKKIYKAHAMDKLYKKLKKCDNTVCSKPNTLFNANLFRKKQQKLKHKESRLLHKKYIEDETDMDLIVR